MDRIPSHALEAVKRLVCELARRIRVERVYVFGSYVRGDWLRTSDVDVVIVSPSFGEMPWLRRLDLVEELQWRMRIRPRVEAIPLTPSELEDRLRTSAVVRDAARYWVELSVEELCNG